MDFLSFFNNKKVFVTGHTGFKGSWLLIWLDMLGAEICGYALEPYTPYDNFVLASLNRRVKSYTGDIRDYGLLNSVFTSFNPEIVFHLAAQPLVRKSYFNPKETFDVNISGTVNILECCRLSDSVSTIINVTSDKCYENIESPRGYNEDDRLGGYDPYSSSKAGSEVVTSAYRNSFFNPENFVDHGKCLASVRAGNIIGGGDWQVDRLVPDCIRALEKNIPIVLRSPGSVRPWQHVLEPLSGYLLLASKMVDDSVKYSRAWNFGPDNNQRVTVGQLAELLIDQWGNGSVQFNSKEINSPHETNELNLDITRAETLLRWHPHWDIYKTVSATVEWYKRYREIDTHQICKKQIEEYMNS